MDSESENDSEIESEIPIFDGTYENFQVWWTRFRAHSAVFKFEAALKIGGETSMPVTEARKSNTRNAGRIQAAAMKRNTTAMLHLTLAFETAGTLNIVEDVKTSDWPGGLAHLVVAVLFKKYHPQDTMARVEMRQILNGIKMKKNEDPTVMFEQISRIKNKYNMTTTKKIEEEDLIAVVMDASSIEYQTILTTEQRHQGINLKLSDFESAMNQHWRQIKMAQKNNENEEEDEKKNIGVVFRGICSKCKKKGHKANDCPEKDNESKKKKFSGKCFICGKRGHREPNCKLREGNKNEE
jgi:hypothetical protein